uniref:DUF4283 domain-containing protein n=1 Tax=Cajanus cajan TaxID=3821 RepID=A0A151RQ90_CAJCA|nr:hypothetical protein KK1_033793 [Cajanus cajan]
MNNKAPLPRMPKADLIGQSLFRIEFEDGNRLKPRCFLDETVVEQLRAPWQEAIIVKLFGKQVGYLTLRDRLKGVWKLVGGYDVMDVGCGFFLVKFDLSEDREKVISGGPWMLFDH